MPTRKILITGGPVHAYLDAVKLVTNRFKGGLMADLASDFATNFDAEVTYLCAKGSTLPVARDNLTVIYHDGFDMYQNLVLAMAPNHTDVILGAAVANLIPATPWKGKFPSHDYQPGDIVPIDFMVAPRIIDDVKAAAPDINLFGFKLLSGVPHEELIRAAYGIVLESHALAVIANDAQNLNDKFIVTKERAVHPVPRSGLAAALWPLMTDVYYKTEVALEAPNPQAIAAFQHVVAHYQANLPQLFTEVEKGLIFGTIAVRDSNRESFWTTARGKTELTGAVHVLQVNHGMQKVFTANAKATLNAPLLDLIFKTMPQVHTIVHAHHQIESLPTVPYAPPGSVRDTRRILADNVSFNIENHGCFLLFDAAGTQLT